VSFDETDTRHDEMHRTIEQWLADLAADVDDARTSEQFQEWLDVQSRFHDYSHRNTLLINLQCPEATKVAGYRTWQEEFDRYVEEGESAIGVTVRIVDPDEWRHGEAKGVCQSRSVQDLTPLVEVKDRSNRADLASTIIHEYAHAILHFDITDATERAKREVEAEAVAYVVGRYLGLDMSGSAFYLAAWQDDETDVLQERLGRISGTAEEILSTLDAV